MYRPGLDLHDPVRWRISCGSQLMSVAIPSALLVGVRLRVGHATYPAMADGQQTRPARVGAGDQPRDQAHGVRRRYAVVHRRHAQWKRRVVSRRSGSGRAQRERPRPLIARARRPHPRCSVKIVGSHCGPVVPRVANPPRRATWFAAGENSSRRPEVFLDAPADQNDVGANRTTQNLEKGMR